MFYMWVFSSMFKDIMEAICKLGPFRRLSFPEWVFKQNSSSMRCTKEWSLHWS